MAKKGIKYSYKLGGMSASLTTFICTAIIFVNARGVISMNTLIYALKIVVPAAIVVGYFGFQVGKIFDSTKKKKKLSSYK